MFMEISKMEIEIETQKNSGTEPQTDEIISIRPEEHKKNYLGYIAIFISQYFSLIGSQIVSFAVIWYLTITTGSSLILSLATFANLVPMIIVSPIAGVIADKFSKNFILIFTDALQAIATLGLILLFHLGIFQIWHIIILMGVRGLCQGFQMPVSIAVTAIMVPDEKIKKINAIQQILSSMKYSRNRSLFDKYISNSKDLLVGCYHIHSFCNSTLIHQNSKGLSR